MPSCSDHTVQAIHNEKFATFLKGHLEYKDWIITVCFYTALHYVEAVFFNMPHIQHTSLSIPKDPTTGKYLYSEHAWREKLIQQHLPQKVYIHFRKLHTNSNTARYLDINKSGLSSSYFTDKDALDAFDKDLQSIKQELKLS